MDPDAAEHIGCVTKVNDMLVRRDNQKATPKQSTIHTSTYKIQMYLKNNIECTTSYAKGRGGGQTGRGGPSLPFIEGGVGDWSPFVEGDGGCWSRVVVGTGRC